MDPILKTLTPKIEIGIDGKFYPADKIGGELSVSAEPGTLRWQVNFTNRAGKPVKLRAFRFLFDRTNSPFFARDSHQMTFFRESWSAVLAAGPSKHGDCDYIFTDNYLPFAAANPGNYQRGVPNHFTSEAMCFLHDRKTKETLHLGFLSFQRMIGEMVCTFEGENGVNLQIDCACDDITVDPGETVPSEILLLAVGNDPWEMLKTYAEKVAAYAGVKIFEPLPTGWCSWYYYFSKITEQDLLDNIEYLKNHRQELNLTYFQVDDGYQSALGDWLETDPAKFTHKMDYVAAKAIEAGMKPAIWLAPFSVEKTSKLFSAHPEWLIRNKDNEILFPINWRGTPTAILDTTIPEVCDYIAGYVGQLHQWGYCYFKLDFVIYECSVTGGIYHDPKATRAMALRRGLEAIRRGAGEESFLLGGTMMLGPAIGLVDGERISTDIAPRWANPGSLSNDEGVCFAHVARNILMRQWMHRRLWLNDPDVLLARRSDNEMTENETMLLFQTLRFNGGTQLLSDRFPTLEPDRLELCRKLLAEPDAYETRPYDYLERRYPALWLTKRKADGKRFLMVVNLGEQPETYPLPQEFGKLPPALELPPHGFRIFELD